MSIVPLPVFEADADPHHRTGQSDVELYEKLEAPKSIVVRFGAMGLVGEYPYDGEAKPGCGTKLVVRTHRGTELAEMLTTTCENAGCSKSVTRKELLSYVEKSGGRDYPFHHKGRVLRVATIEDLNKQSSFISEKPALLKRCRQLVAEMELELDLVDVELMLGGEQVIYYYTAENRIDFRELVKELARDEQARIEMRQVGARDEARLTADYERCGQYCCCKNFLKVLKPVSMRSAKVQKATLDPLKISGRCGRLMCCLRYEDQTYKDLKARLPHRKSRVGTPEGPGIVLETKILVQLVLVRLEFDQREIAVPVEDLCDPDACPVIEEPAPSDPFRGMAPAKVKEKIQDGAEPPERRKRRRRRRRRKPGEAGEASEAAPQARDDVPRPAARTRGGEPKPAAPAGDEAPRGERTTPSAEGEPKKRRRRRRRRKRRGPGEGGGGEGGGGGEQGAGD